MADVDQRANDVYDLIHVPARRLPTALRTAAVFVANLFSMGGGPSNPGGGHYRVIDRASGEPVGTIDEWFGDDAISDELRRDLTSLSQGAFAEKWL